MNEAQDFVDLYELLQVSPNAENDTIQRVFRLLAQRFHPDNKETGDEPMFQQMVKAYQVLSDPVKRAAFDAVHREKLKVTWQVFDKKDEPAGRDDEAQKRLGILGVLYRKRKFNVNNAGMNIREIEDLVAIPREHLEFPLWYLKESGLLRPGDNGKFAITVAGIDRYEAANAPAKQWDDLSHLHLLPAARPKAG